MATVPLPPSVAAAGVKSARDLDVRTVLAKGGDPFQLIMKTVGQVAPDEALRLIVPFEPRPLYAVLGALGYGHATERAGDVYNVFFYRDPGAAAAVAENKAARVPLKPPVELDVRGLEPPGPMLAILEKLTEIGPGAQLRVRHHRDPVLLYDKLAARGYAARAEKQPEGDYIVTIAPDWALEGKGA